MTYSRQQRERAVDLYIKYEHSAADVIHELGYPSRTILYVWYRERLEEERTGVPSGRGQRHRRYSDEQKQACVCSIESGPCERVESLQMSGRF